VLVKIVKGWCLVALVIAPLSNCGFSLRGDFPFARQNIKTVQLSSNQRTKNLARARTDKALGSL